MNFRTDLADKGRQGYNAIQMAKMQLTKPRRKRTLNLSAVCVSFLLPFAVFCWTGAFITFSVHYTYPYVAYAAIIASLLVVLTFGGLGFYAMHNNDETLQRDPTWFLFIFVTASIGWVMALLIGEYIFWHNFDIYHQIHKLDLYRNVDPSTSKGTRYMDAGRVSFAEGSKLDITMSTGFKNKDWYCAAPIVMDGQTSKFYDFWAVGLNCCSDAEASYTCGDYDNDNARSGLRLTRGDQLDFYKIAVQGAKVTYGLTTNRPVFFFWVADADAELDAYKTDGKQFLILACLCFFFWQVFVTIAAIVFLTRT